MRNERPLTLEIKAKIDHWLEQNYDDLVAHTEKKLKRYGHSNVDPCQFLSHLYDTLLRLAYGHGWAEDEDILKQSKRRLTGYVQDLHAKKQHDSFEVIQEAHEDHGRELPEAFIVEPDHEHRMQLEYIAEAMNAVCETDYDRQLLESLGPELSITKVADQFEVHHSTVSRDRKKLINAIREYVLKQGWV